MIKIEEQEAKRRPRLLDFLAVTAPAGLHTQADVHAWSIRERDRFWRGFLDWSGLRYGGSAERVCDGGDIETARFFPDATLNYADNLLSPDFPDDAIALISVGEGRPARSWTRRALRDAVERVAGSLRALGLGPGDAVGAITCNTDEAAVLALATAAIGGIYAGSSVDMGRTALLERLAPVSPRLLVVNAAAAKGEALQDHLGSLLPELPTIRTLVALGDPPADTIDLLPTLRFADLLAAPPLSQAEWPRLPFDHPLFVLFTSGTTGPPKGIVHGAGGTLIEHLKEHRLHCDLGSDDILYFQTSAAWMMWSWQLSALASGATIVLADGFADPLDAWRVAAEQKVTMFGTSPAYLRLSANAGIMPARRHDLGALRGLLSTGSPLFAEQHEWVWQAVGSTVRVQSISGGTDILGCFLLGSPIAPNRAGEIQALSLGLDVRAWGADGDDPVGELVCASPFPSRPIGLLDDPDGARFHDSYFSRNPGLWTHGDAVEIRGDGSATVHGRSDGVLNLRGIRVGPAEIYRLLFRLFPDIAAAMAVEQRDAAHPDGRLILLLVLCKGAALHLALELRIRRTLAAELSPAHVPHLILAVDALPMTHNGKQSEAAMTDVLNGRAIRNAAALRNPESLSAIRDAVACATALPAGENHAGRSLERRLITLWADTLQRPVVGPDDDFFELGGDSLAAVTLFAAIQEETGTDLPFTTILRAPTVARMLVELQAAGGHGPWLTRYRAGSGRPVFWMHGLLGIESFLARLADAMTGDRPLFAVEIGAQACASPRSVSQMASDYLALIRAEQPHGPYTLGGYSMGGLIAYAMAQQLTASGESVDILYLLDPLVHWRQRSAVDLLRDAGRMLGALWSQKTGRTLLPADTLPDVPEPLTRIRSAMLEAWAAYRPTSYAGRILLAVPQQPWPMSCPGLWRHLAPACRTIVTPGDHGAMMREPTWLARAIEQPDVPLEQLPSRALADLTGDDGLRPALEVGL